MELTNKRQGLIERMNHRIRALSLISKIEVCEEAVVDSFNRVNECLKSAESQLKKRDSEGVEYWTRESTSAYQEFHEFYKRMRVLYDTLVIHILKGYIRKPSIYKPKEHYQKQLQCA